MNAAYGMLPALDCHILFPCCCVSPASCRFVCKLSKCPVLHGPWRLLPLAPSQQGLPDSVPMPHAGPRCPPLACQTCRASRCTHMPIHSTASCAWLGASTISLPAPQPPTLDDACSEVRGEVSHIDYKGTDNLCLISSAP